MKVGECSILQTVYQMILILKIKVNNYKKQKRAVVPISKMEMTVNSDDQWTEDEAETPAGVTDIMLTNTHYFEDSQPQRGKQTLKYIQRSIF